MQVPEVGEGPAQVLHAGAGDPDVRVAPLGLVRRPDVVAADVGLLVVDHQDLAVVAAVAAQVEEAPAGGVDGVAEHLHRCREALEPRRHHEVREAVVDAVDLDAPVGRRRQRGLELLADRVALPDVGLEEDLPLRALDRGQHVGVQVLAEGVRRDRPLADLDRGGRRGGERLGLLAAAPVGVDQAHPDPDRDRDPEDHRERPPYPDEHALDGLRAAPHAANLVNGRRLTAQRSRSRSRPGPHAVARAAPRPGSTRPGRPPGRR